MSTFTPAFNAVKGLPRLLREVMPEGVAALKQLLASASQQEEGPFIVGIQGVLENLATSLEDQDYTAANPTAIFAHLEKLMSALGEFIQDVEPKLALQIKAALAAEAADKKEALIALLRNHAFSGALAVNLKAHLTPSHLNEKEKIQSTLDWAFESLHTDNQHAAGQAAYDPERAFIRQLLRLLFTLVKMVSAPPPRSSLEKKGEHRAAERLIPMKMG